MPSSSPQENLPKIQKRKVITKTEKRKFAKRISAYVERCRRAKASIQSYIKFCDDVSLLRERAKYHNLDEYDRALHVKLEFP